MIDPVATTSRTADGRGAAEEELPQYSRAHVFGIWAAVTVTMSVLGWGVAPLLADHLSTRDPFIDSLLICFDVGLVLMLALVAVLVRRERGSLSWPDVRDGLRLRAPQSSKTGSAGAACGGGSCRSPCCPRRSTRCPSTRPDRCRATCPWRWRRSGSPTTSTPTGGVSRWSWRTPCSRPSWRRSCS